MKVVKKNWLLLNFFVFLSVPATVLAQGIFAPPMAPGTQAENTSVELAIKIVTIFIGLVGLFTIFFLFSGISKYMTSTGDEEKVEKSKKTVIASLTGIVILLLAFALVRVVVNAIIV